MIDLIEIQQEHIEWLEKNLYQITTILLDLKADHNGYKREISADIKKLNLRLIYGKTTIQKINRWTEKKKVAKDTKKIKFK